MPDGVEGSRRGGHCIKDDGPHGNQTFLQECSTASRRSAVVVRQAAFVTDQTELFTANSTANEPNEMITPGSYILRWWARWRNS